MASLSESDPQEGDLRSYTVQISPPMGRSYAEHIARQHGINYDQLLEMLEQHGILD